MLSFEGGRLLMQFGRPLWRPWNKKIVTEKNIVDCKFSSIFENPGSGSGFN
jgi:hypothetical protein